jgi:hypothetical protein
MSMINPVEQSRIARQIFSAVTGMSIWATPNSDSASTMALTTAAGAGVVPPSPPPLAPIRLVFVGTSLWPTANSGKSSARGIA